MDSNQLTILFHIDDLMTCHVGSHIVTEYVKLLDKANGAKDPLMVTLENFIEYLGVNFDFRFKRGVVT